jgi:NAD(P)-dependent dehydrogenase (short-subunit alcohol dehydrogenase family)
MNFVITGRNNGMGRSLAELPARHGCEVCRLARSRQDSFSFLLSRFSLFAFHVAR